MLFKVGLTSSEKDLKMIDEIIIKIQVCGLNKLDKVKTIKVTQKSYRSTKNTLSP